MSITMYYRPISNKGVVLEEGSNSLRIALENCFGQLPCIVDEYGIGKLDGIAACGHNDAKVLIKAIRRVGEIQISGEY